MKQLKMGFLNDYKKEFGGSLLVGKRKTARPLTTKTPIHLVLKSCHKGVFNPGNFSLEKLIKFQAQKFNIKVYDFALNWNHIHLVIKLNKREDYTKFIRSLTSILAQKIRLTRHVEKIFTLRPYTRILSWGRQFKNTLNYQILNQLEARGLINRTKDAKPLEKNILNIKKNYVTPGLIDAYESMLCAITFCLASNSSFI